MAANVPGVPAICFRVIFIRGDEFNISLHEICKCFLLSALNIQLKQKKKALKRKKNQTKPKKPSPATAVSESRSSGRATTACGHSMGFTDTPKLPVRPYNFNRGKNSTHKWNVFRNVSKCFTNWHGTAHQTTQAASNKS